MTSQCLSFTANDSKCVQSNPQVFIEREVLRRSLSELKLPPSHGTSFYAMSSLKRGPCRTPSRLHPFTEENEHIYTSLMSFLPFLPVIKSSDSSPTAEFNGLLICFCEENGLLGFCIILNPKSVKLWPNKVIIRL